MTNEFRTKIESLKKKSNNFSILYVEDEPSLREKISDFFNKIFKHVDVAANGEEGLHKYLHNKYDIVITDIQMPKMNGLELIERIREKSEYQEVIVVSAYTDPEYLTQCIKLNVTGYIIKPIDFDQILQILDQSIYKLTAFHENEMYREKLESMVSERTKMVLDLQHQQVENYQQAIHSLVKMVEARDPYTGGHSERVAKYSKEIAEAMGLSQEEINMIYEAGILHDIGKIITPDIILLKPGRLTEDEFSLIKEHVTFSYKILTEIPMYHNLADIVYGHHENYDGSGYPQGIKGDEILLLSRIMAIADSFDAMTTSRIYKARKSIHEAIEELKELSGTLYDPSVVEAASKVLKLTHLDNDITQEPHSKIDDERFAYFYTDALTHVYNHHYLDVILNGNNKNPLYMNVIYMKNFSSYNQKHGWSEGDALLNTFSTYLKLEFSNFKIFRIFGDDFVLMSDKAFEIDIDKINAAPLLQTNDIYCEHKYFEVQQSKINSYKDLEE